MRVLQLISSGIGFYGAERVVTTLSAELARTGTHVVVAAFVNAGKAPHLEVLDVARQSGLETSEIPCHGRVDRHAVQAIRTLVRDHAIDVIHSHDPKTDLYAYLAARHGSPAIISTCHTWYSVSLTDHVISLIDRAVLGGFDAVVVVSDAIRRPLRCSLVPNSRVTTIDNGIDCPATGSTSPATRGEARTPGRIVIGTAARLSSQKGLPYLLQALADVLPEFPGATLVIAGDGPDREALRNQAEALGLLPSVTFLGRQSDMSTFYASIDVFVLPSLAEGLPMALLEAMAAERAVVASAVGSVPAVIEDHVNGIMVTPADPSGLADVLREVLRSPDLRARLGRNARSTVESRFSATVMAKRYGAIYESVCQSRASGVHLTGNTTLVPDSTRTRQEEQQ